MHQSASDVPTATLRTALPFGLDRPTTYACLVFLLFFATAWKEAWRLMDPDTFWHVAIGAEILATGEWPRVDRWSHTFFGEPWIAKEWLGQIALALAWDLGGWQAVIVLTAGTFALTAAATLHYMATRLDAPPALALFAVMALLASAQILARPLIFFPLLLVIWLTTILRAVEAGRAPPLLLALLMCVWANTHASFLVGIAFAGVLGLEALARAPAQSRLRLTAGWAAFGIASVSATTLTPYGWTPLLVAFSVFDSNEAVPFIAEWNALDVLGADVVALPGFIAAALVILSAPRQMAFRAVIVAICVWLALSHVRFVPLFAIVSMLVLVDPLARAHPALAAGPRGSPRMRRTTLAAAGTIASLFAGIVLMRPAVPTEHDFGPALAAADAAGLATRPVMNDYDLGGYLIARGIPTFIDGRTDQLFLGGFTHAYFTALVAGDAQALTRIADEHDAAWALTVAGSSLDRALAGADAWRVVYGDDGSRVYERER